MSDHRLDFRRSDRTGVAEAVLATGKSVDQLLRIVETVLANDERMLVTRLDHKQSDALQIFGAQVQTDPASRTAVIGQPLPVTGAPSVGVITAGTSDLPVAREAVSTLAFAGEPAGLVTDVGVAGLWRLMDRLDEICSYRVIIAVAGMEGALFSVLAGLVRAPVIAVPSSVGYGVSAGGQAALSSALATCAPGVVTVNIDNGFGAAAAALKILHAGRG